MDNPYFEIGYTWEWVSSTAINPAGTLVVCGYTNGKIYVWDINSGEIIKTISGHSSGLNSVNFSPDGTKIISGSDDKIIELWDVNTGNLLNTFSGHLGRVFSVNFSPDGTKITSGSGDGTVKLWDVNTGKLIKTFYGHIGYILSVNFSPDGTMIASGDDWHNGVIILWEVSTGKLIRALYETTHANQVNSVKFNSDGTKIISGNYDRTVKLWDAEKGNLINAYYVNSPVASVDFSPDGKTIPSSGTDLVLWDVNSGNRIVTFWGIGNVLSVNFSHDGKYLAAGLASGVVRIYPMTSTVAVKERGSIPEKYTLFQNYPNPFNPATVISYHLSEDGFVTLKIYNILGNEIACLVNEKQNIGIYNVSWEPKSAKVGFSSGLYFYKLVVSGSNPLQMEKYSEIKKMVYLK